MRRQTSVEQSRFPYALDTFTMAKPETFASFYPVSSREGKVLYELVKTAVNKLELN